MENAPWLDDQQLAAWVRVAALLDEQRASLERIEITLPSVGEPISVCRWDTTREPTSVHSDRR